MNVQVRSRRPRRARGALALALLAADLACAPLGREAAAVWVFDSTAPYVGRAPLEFELIVEKFVFLQIGSAGSTVDEVRFDLGAPVAASIGPSGTNVAAPAAGLLPGGGEPIVASAGGSQKVLVRGNQGSITLSVAGASPSGMSNGTGGAIGYDQILIRSDNPGLPAPVIDATGRGAAAVNASAYGGLVTDQQATWVFVFANTRPAPGGTYKGQLAFTISMP